MWQTFVFLITVTLACSFPSGNVSGKDYDVQAGVINEMYYLGTADGKSYFADDAKLRNWNAARLHCEASGMRLASVESAAQRDVLVSKGNTTHFNDAFWTAGVDAQNHNQIKWSTNKRAISSSYVRIDWFVAPQTCLVFYSAKGHNDFHTEACVREFRTLCETPPAISV